jgi:hypothetical protein
MAKAPTAPLTVASQAYCKMSQLPTPSADDGTMMNYVINITTNSGLVLEHGFDISATATTTQINNAIVSAVQQVILDTEGTSLNASKIQNFDKAT